MTARPSAADATSSAGAAARDARRATWLRVGLIALTVAVFAPTVRHDFVNWDDPSYVTSNPHVRAGLTWDGVRWAFTTGHAANWHPLTWLSHMLDVSVFGMDAGAHHLTSLVLHVANALLLFDVLRRATAATWRSAFCAALFAVHPLHVESVAWVAERKDVLSTLFWMLTLEAYVAYVRRPAPWRYAAVALCFAAGLLSKPMLVTLPFTLLLLDRWPLGRASDAASFRRLVVEKAPLFALAAASCVVTVLVQRGSGAVAGVEMFPVADRVANAATSYVAYVGRTFWPAGLAAFHPYPRSFPAAQVAAAAIVLAAATAVAAWQARARPWLLVGWLWFLGTLLPVIGLVQVGLQSMAERYTYVPLVGLFVIVAWGAAELVGGGSRRRVAVATAGAFAVLACAVAARAQVEVWRDSDALWRHALAVTTDNATAHADLGSSLCDRGRFAEAEAEFREVLRLRPGSADAHNDLGHALRKQKKFDAAVAEFEEAVRLEPAFAQAHGNLGLALREQGRLPEAVARLEEAVRLKPDYAAARHDLAVALAGQGRLAEAIVEISEALRLAPDDAAAHADLGLMFERAGDVAGALREFGAALRLDPTDVAVRTELERLSGRR